MLNFRISYQVVLTFGVASTPLLSTAARVASSGSILVMDPIIMIVLGLGNRQGGLYQGQGREKMVSEKMYVKLLVSGGMLNFRIPVLC
jgi:hypothetical protein